MQDSSRDIISQAAALLIAKGYTREWAEEVLRAQSYSAQPETPEEWVDQILRREAGDGEPGDASRFRMSITAPIPPYEPPARE